MATIQDRKLEKKRSEHILGKLSHDNITENMEKNNIMPEFNYNDPHVQDWIKNKKNKLRKKKPNLTDKDFLKFIAKKITVFNKDDIFIDDDELYIVNGKICVIAPDLKELPEFDWDDPENKKIIQKEEELRIKKYGKLTGEQLDKIDKVKELLLKTNPNLSRKKAFDLAWEKMINKKLPQRSNRYCPKNNSI